MAAPKEKKSSAGSSGSSGSSGRRKIGRWYLGETLGKGGYSWVKKGRDRKTNRCVALKFMERKKKTSSSGSKQLRQVKTEIEALKHMKHPHIVRLLAYNLSTKYPDRATETDGKEDGDGTGVVYRRDVILLVLEYMAGGELFDILYYTSKLDEIVARTYLRQLMSGLEACHNASIVHRDIKPQNLLLGKTFNLKITDFGLAKLQESDSDVVMETYNVGTRGYQAPEVLLKRPYTSACDIFSVGVVLFILLAGYPPFEHAKQTDRWYSAIAQHDYKQFWRSHKGCGIAVPAQDLISRMLRFDSSKRISIAQMKQHPWYMAEVLDGKQLGKVLRLRHMQMELKRANDPIKKEIMQHSVRKTQGPRPMIPRLEQEMKRLKLELKSPAKLLGEEEAIGMLDVFTVRPFIEVLNVIEEKIVGECQGKCDTFLEHCSLRASVALMTSESMDPTMSKTVKIIVEIHVYLSEEWQSNVVKFFRVSGSHRTFREFVKYLVKDSIFTGMPETRTEHVKDKLLTPEATKQVAQYFPGVSSSVTDSV